MPSSPAASPAPSPRAVLLDVYETVLTVDMRAVFTDLIETSGRPESAWRSVADHWGHGLTLGTTTMGAVFTEVLGTSDGVPALLERDVALLREHVTVFPDVEPALRRLRAAGVATVFVSNCNEHTRPLLEGLGLADLVDHLVLSCEVHLAKPDPAIYRHALSLVSCSPAEAVFVDDKADYCDAADALGLAAVQIERHDPSTSLPTTLDTALAAVGL